MKIQVMGSGCPTCKKLYDLTQKAVSDLKIIDKVEYLTGDEGVQAIIESGAMGSPVLTVDGKVVLTGFTPDIKKIKNAITSCCAPGCCTSKEKSATCTCGDTCC